MVFDSVLESLMAVFAEIVTLYMEILTEDLTE